MRSIILPCMGSLCLMRSSFLSTSTLHLFSQPFLSYYARGFVGLGFGMGHVLFLVFLLCLSLLDLCVAFASHGFEDGDKFVIYL